MARWQDFRTCPTCGLDLATGEGERGCAWGECPYLPEELNVWCDYCRFNFLTMEGNSPCPDPMACDHAAEPLSHLDTLRSWLAARDASRAGERVP
ncbi:MAG: hypothetical protein HY658_07125 [Actinobacteria bacterium]|nr:hypothetical protein [Actinomycetota bacterium]